MKKKNTKVVERSRVVYGVSTQNRNVLLLPK